MKINEHNYLTQLQHGNEEALYFVMTKYGGLVKSVVHRHLYNLSQYEEDCINDVFYAVWTHISSYQAERNSFANWIAGIARLKALDYVRKHARQLQEIHYEDHELLEIPDTTNEYERLEQDVLDDIEHLLAGLKEKDRELFYRLYVEQETMDEIEEHMQIEKATLYNRLSRAKKKLRKNYGKA